MAGQTHQPIRWEGRGWHAAVSQRGEAVVIWVEACGLKGQRHVLKELAAFDAQATLSGAAAGLLFPGAAHPRTTSDLHDVPRA